MYFRDSTLARSMRTQAGLVDQLFNSSEKRLARILLLMAEFGKLGEPETLIPKITQETLAEMVGTTRSRVSFFMNRFRDLGFIEYNGAIKVHKSLLNCHSARLNGLTILLASLSGSVSNTDQKAALMLCNTSIRDSDTYGGKGIRMPNAKAKVLVVDDDDTLRISLSRIFSECTVR
jgi:hypothetical protein